MQVFLEKLRKLMTQWRTVPAAPAPAPAKKTKTPRTPKNEKTVS